GCKLITIDPRRIELADYGAIHLSPRPGTNAAVVLGLCHVIHREGLVDSAFIAERTEGWGAVEELLAGYDPAAVEEITGITAADHLHRVPLGRGGGRREPLRRRLGRAALPPQGDDDPADVRRRGRR